MGSQIIIINCSSIVYLKLFSRSCKNYTVKLYGGEVYEHWIFLRLLPRTKVLEKHHMQDFCQKIFETQEISAYLYLPTTSIVKYIHTLWLEPRTSIYWFK